MQRLSIPAIIAIIGTAGALGDAGSPASDSTLGPTAGLAADGQHNHIWDTCVPTFILWPIMITQVLLYSMNLIDTMMSGRAGVEDLAGVAIGSSFWAPVSTGINGILLAVTAIVHHIAYHYLVGLATGILPLFMFSVLRNFIDAQGFTRISLYVITTSLPLNIFFNYTLIFGNFGFPELGDVYNECHRSQPGGTQFYDDAFHAAIEYIHGNDHCDRFQCRRRQA